MSSSMDLNLCLANVVSDLSIYGKPTQKTLEEYSNVFGGTELKEKYPSLIPCSIISILKQFLLGCDNKSETELGLICSESLELINQYVLPINKKFLMRFFMFLVTKDEDRLMLLDEKISVLEQCLDGNAEINMLPVELEFYNKLLTYRLGIPKLDIDKIMELSTKIKELSKSMQDIPPSVIFYAK